MITSFLSETSLGSDLFFDSNFRRRLLACRTQLAARPGKGACLSAGLTLRRFYFRIYHGAIGEIEVIDFPRALVRHIQRPLLIVWDRLPAHRSKLVREFIALWGGYIATEYLGPYAPEGFPERRFLRGLHSRGFQERA